MLTKQSKFFMMAAVSILFLSVVFLGGGYLKAAGQTDNPTTETELTVYNDNLALIKDHRMMDLPGGISPVSFTDVAALIDPTSVKFRAINSPGIKVLEQNFEYDVINDSRLLQKYLGQKISLTTLKGETRSGYLVGAGEDIILASTPKGGSLEVIKAGQIQSISFPETPSGLVVRPTLVWLLSNPEKSGRQPIELTYLTAGLSWRANYVATVNPNDDKVDLTGWVTLDNKSGADFDNSRLKLVAGDVNRAPETEMPKPEAVLYSAAKMRDGAQEFQEQSFFEYHLYTLNRTTTLKNNQLKQVELLSAANVSAKKLFIYDGAAAPKKVKVMLEFKNSKDNNMGMPLPKGIIRVQKADSEGSLQFIGEDRIDHTPKDEKVRVYLGNAFDIVGERVQTNVKQIGDRSREESFKITLRNHKKETVTVTAVENMYYWPEWKIIASDRNYTKTESNKVEFSVSIPADGEATINYTARYKW